MTGTIIKALAGFYYVDCDGVLFECKARGSFRKSGVSPLVADRVEFDSADQKTGIIQRVLERKNCLVRPPVANIDKLFIVSSYTTPEPNPFIIDKMTVLAAHNNIESVIVFNKCDMGNFDGFEKVYKNAGFKTYTVSAATGEGLDRLCDEMSGCVSAFTGNSGVGKSSILNAIFKTELIETGEVSQKLGRGRHTTRHTQLYRLQNGGYVADTPGFSSLEIDFNDYSFKENLAQYFKEFEPHLSDCRFTSCSHTTEKGCAVLAAVQNGEIEASRHASYTEIYNALKDLKPWNIKKGK